MNLTFHFLGDFNLPLTDDVEGVPVGALPYDVGAFHKVVLELEQEEEV